MYMNIYFARDIDNTLHMFYQEKPKSDEAGFWYSNIPQWRIIVDQQLFPHLTWEHEPVEIDTENMEIDLIISRNRRMYLTRDKNDNLYVWIHYPPIRHKETESWILNPERPMTIWQPHDLFPNYFFPEITWESEPVEFTEDDLRNCFKQNEIKKVKKQQYDERNNQYAIQNKD